MQKRRHFIVSAAILLASSLGLGLPLAPAQATLEQTLAPYPADTMALMTVSLDPANWEYLISKLAQNWGQFQVPVETEPPSDTESSEAEKTVQAPDELALVIKFLQKDLKFDPLLDGVANLGSHLTLAYRPYPGTDGQGMFSLNLRSAARVQTLIERFKTALAKAGKADKMSEITFGPLKIYQLENGLKEGDPNKLYFALSGNNLVGSFAQDPDLVKRMLYTAEVLSPKSRFKLANHPQFTPVRESLDKKSLWTYLNLSQAFKEIPFLAELNQPEDKFEKELVNSLLSEAGSAGVGLDLDQHSLRIKSFLLPDWENLSPQQQAYLKARQAEPQHPLSALVENLPGQPIVLAMAQNDDPAIENPSALNQVLQKIQQESGLSEELLREGLKSVLNLDYKQELGPTLDGRVGFGLFETSPKKLGTVLYVGIKDGQEQSFDKLTQSQLRFRPEALEQLGELAERLDRSPGAESTLVQANMYTLQTLVETFAVDWGGAYPANLEQLMTEAKKQNYWKDLKNPLSKSSEDSLAAYSEFKTDASQAGMVFYQPTELKNTPEGRLSMGYVIYGYGPDGKLFKMDNISGIETVREDLPKGQPQAPEIVQISDGPETVSPKLLENWQGTPIYSFELQEAVQKLMTGDMIQAKNSILKSNMYSMQANLAIYYLDKYSYPASLKELMANQPADYPLDLSNPVSMESGIGQAMEEYTAFKADASQAGMVFYEAQEPFKNEDGSGGNEGFAVYGYGVDGVLYKLDKQGNLTEARKDLPKPELQEESDNPFKQLKPVFARKGQVWMLALDPETLKAALQGKPSSQLQQAIQDTGTQKASGLFYLDPQTGMNMLEQLLPELNREDSDYKEFQALLKPWKSLFSGSVQTSKGSENEFVLKTDFDQVDLGKWSSLINETSSQFTSAQERAKTSSVKANMHTLQTIVETYAVDFGGVYAPNIEELKKEAQKSGFAYWKEFQNPFNPDGISYQNFNQFAAGPESAGRVFYEPIADENGSITHYKIYGADSKGQLIQDKGETFYLSND